MNAAEKKLVQQILDSNLENDEKMDILKNAGIKVGREYKIEINVTTSKDSTQWIDKIGAYLEGSDIVISYGIPSVEERKVGDVDWEKNYWVMPEGVTPVSMDVPDGRQFAFTGQLAPRGRHYTFHKTDNKQRTVCGNPIRTNWKFVPYDKNLATYNNHTIKFCGQCGAP